MIASTMHNDKNIGFAEKSSEGGNSIKKAEKGLFGSILKHAQQKTDSENTENETDSADQKQQQVNTQTAETSTSAKNAPVSDEVETTESDSANENVAVVDEEAKIVDDSKSNENEKGAEVISEEGETVSVIAQVPVKNEQKLTLEGEETPQGDSVETEKIMVKDLQQPRKIDIEDNKNDDHVKAADSDKKSSDVEVSSENGKKIEVKEPKVMTEKDREAENRKEIASSSPDKKIVTEYSQSVEDTGSEKTVNDKVVSKEQIKPKEVQPDTDESGKFLNLEKPVKTDGEQVGTADKGSAPINAPRNSQKGSTEIQSAAKNNLPAVDRPEQPKNEENTEKAGKDTIIPNNKFAEVASKNPEIVQSKIARMREANYKKHLSAFTERGEVLKSERPDSGTLPKGFSTEMINNIKISAVDIAQAESNTLDQLTPKEELFWKNHHGEMVKGGDSKGADNLNVNFMRLGQVPVSNLSIRRILPSITQNAIKAASSAKGNQEVWQKHNFVLEDGNNVQLSARQVDGVMQLKLSASQHELGRLLQQHHQQIKEHLEKELNLQVDLQFEASGEQDTSGFSEEFSQGEKKGNRGPAVSSGGNGSKSTNREQNNLLNTVRKFGYNQKEWTI